MSDATERQERFRTLIAELETQMQSWDEETQLRALVLISERQGELRSHCLNGASPTLPEGTRTLPPPRMSVLPAAAEPVAEMPADTPRARLGDWLEQVLLSILRAGLDHAHDSPTVLELIASRQELSGLPTSLMLARWVGRLRRALSARDDLMLLILLRAADAALVALREPQGSALSSLWLGRWVLDGRHDERFPNRELIEVARERVDGWHRASLERRFLIDPRTGASFCEWARHEEIGLSAGPCPRRVNLALASLLRLPQPGWLRVHQYATTPFVEAEHIEQLAAHAYRRVDTILDSYFAAQEAALGVSEPFVLFAPHRLDDSPLAPMGEDNRILPVIGASEAWSEALEALWRKQKPVVLIGRLLMRFGRLYLAPRSVLVRDATRLTLQRVF